MAVQHYNYNKPINISCEQNFEAGYSDLFQRFEVLSVVAMLNIHVFGDVRRAFGLLVSGISKGLWFKDTA
jgi:hypothetical protein